MSEEQTEQKDTRNFSDKYLNNIFEILMKLEEYERLSKNGCSTLLDYIQNTELNLDIIQEQNYQFFMTEFKIVLNDVQSFILKEDYEEMEKEVMSMEIRENILGGYLGSNSDCRDNSESYFLKEEFFNMIPKISHLRKLLIKALIPFLDPSMKKPEEKSI